MINRKKLLLFGKKRELVDPYPTNLYTSDFSVNTNGWYSFTGTVFKSVGDINGVSDTIGFYPNSSGGGHILGNNNILIVGTPVRLRFDYYIPNTNTNVDGISILNNFTVVYNMKSNSVTPAVVGAWATSDDIEFTPDSNVFKLTSTMGPAPTFTGTGSPTDDLIYYKNIIFDY